MIDTNNNAHETPGRPIPGRTQPQPPLFAASRRQSPAALKSTSGELVPLIRVSATGRLEGLLFEMTVEQYYRNTSATPLESVYTFPIPVNAVLLAFELELNGTKYVATAFSKRQAEHKYEAAIDDGNSAALLVDNGNGLFTVNVANLMPGEVAVVRYHYAEMLSAHQNHVRLSVPTVIAPRYGNPADAQLAGPAIPGADLLVEYPFALCLALVGVTDDSSVHSPTHSIVATRKDHVLSVEISDRGFLDRDFVLLLSMPAASISTLIARHGHEHVAVASFCVGAESAEYRPLVAKILLDCSGSMAGDSIEAAKRALRRFLDEMTPADRFSLSRFGSSVEEITEGFEPGDAHTLDPLKLIVARIAADLGGTEMAGAIQATINIPMPEGRASDLLLITDGEIFAVDSVVDVAKKSGHRLFVVAIGAAPNEALARKISELTGGACDFVAAGEAVEPAILRMLGRLRAAPRRIAAVRWPATPLWTSPIPRAVFPGEMVHIMAGFSSELGGAVVITVKADESGATEVVLPLATQVTVGNVIPRLAAARRMFSLSAEQGRNLAIEHQLVSEHTSLVLVAERAEGAKAQQIPTTVSVPQMLAAGWGGSSRARAPSAAGDAPRIHRMTMDECRFERQFSDRMEERVCWDETGGLRDELQIARRPLIAAVQARLLAGGTLPMSLKDLHETYRLSREVRTWLLRCAMSVASEETIIRAFLELLDRAEGLLDFPPLDAETRLKVRMARRKMELHM